MITMKLNPYIIFPLIACLSLMGCVKDGIDGKNSLIDQIAEPPSVNCPAGGYKIITGIDDNRNNELDSNEIQETNYVCNGNYNKETVINFNYDISYGTGSVQGVIPTQLGIDNFNITNYLSDSASFSCYLFTGNANAKCQVELYDMTNNKVIANTLLTSNSVIWELKTTTVNFINEFPKNYIKLGCRIRTEKEGTTVWISKAWIKLYRK
jgi:hypothetical protein